MREILFRGKNDLGENWFEGDLRHFDHETIIIAKYGGEYCEVRPETVGQYTGLTDKNGKRIFEGDIVIFKTTNYSFEPCVVEYRNDIAQFVVITNGRSYPMADDFDYTVIGNIHDNPELIGGKEDALS